MTQGLILFAHGARDPRWAAPFEDMAARIRAHGRSCAVRLAFLEFMTPDLAARRPSWWPPAARASTWCRCSWAAAAMCARTCRAAGRAAPAPPGLRFTLHTAIGEVAAWCRRWPPSPWRSAGRK
jgi:sirohydrochlorin cobaltochelatase